MNEQNAEYLKKVLDNLGFGKRLNDVMENAIRREMPKFTLGLNNTHTPPHMLSKQAPPLDHIRFELNFNRGRDSDVYFLNNYKVSLRRAGEPEARVQTFDLERDHRITALQAYKLLSGHAFEKEIFAKPKDAEFPENQEKVRTWFKLELGVTDAYVNHPLRTLKPEYGFNLAESLTKYPIKGLGEGEKLDEALKALRNGNLVTVDLTLNKKQVPVLIGANPIMKNLDVFDKNMEAIRDWEIFPEKAAAMKEKNHPRVTPSAAETGQEHRPWEQEAGEERVATVGRGS